jgi:hypothetical protein
MILDALKIISNENSANQMRVKHSLVVILSAMSYVTDKDHYGKPWGNV